MAELKQQDVIEYIKDMSVLEVSEMVKKLEDELGVQGRRGDADGRHGRLAPERPLRPPRRRPSSTSS